MGRLPTKEPPPAKVEHILHFNAVSGTLLPAGHVLWFNTGLGTLLWLATLDGGASALIAEQQFTNAEVYILSCLLSDYPHYSPYEVVLAHFVCGGTATDGDITQAREDMKVAKELGGTAWDILMRPMRNVNSRTRLKLEEMNITIVAFHDFGYMLMPLRHI